MACGVGALRTGAERDLRLAMATKVDFQIFPATTGIGDALAPMADGTWRRGTRRTGLFLVFSLTSHFQLPLRRSRSPLPVLTHVVLRLPNHQPEIREAMLGDMAVAAVLEHFHEQARVLVSSHEDEWNFRTLASGKLQSVEGVESGDRRLREDQVGPLIGKMLPESLEGINMDTRRLKSLKFELIHQTSRIAQIVLDDQNVCFGPHALTSSGHFYRREECVIDGVQATVDFCKKAREWEKGSSLEGFIGHGQKKQTGTLAINRVSVQQEGTRPRQVASRNVGATAKGMD